MPDSRSSSVSHPPSIADSATSAALANNAPAPAPKKGKGKKSTDPADASKQIAAKIAQLELDAAGEKDQEAEIGGFCLIMGDLGLKIAFDTQLASIM